MPGNAALALSPDIHLCSRRPALEREALDKLAAWALRFTPVTSPDPCGALLLEIAGSLRLFGGIEPLRAAVVDGSRQRGHVVLAAVAPTARAALWLAHAGHDLVVAEPARLPSALGQLSVNLPGWPDAVLRRLRGMGISRLGECMRLPRDGLARRIGRERLAEIDEALGRLPELRRSCRPTTQFRDEIELPAETVDSSELLEALGLLLLRLDAHLRSHQAGARILWVRLRHRVGDATLLRIGLLGPSANIRHLRELAAIHFSALRVPAPVTAVALAADVAELAPAAVVDLLGRRRDQGERFAALVERLRIRLGMQAVHGLWIRQEHRPELAWEAAPEPGTRGRRSVGPAGPCAPRPLWILERPLLLAERSGAPLFHGVLVPERGPERIETGWWDGHDVQRDYYVARNPRGTRAWIFRDRRSGSWHLHGLFG